MTETKKKEVELVQTFGRKKNAIAVATIRPGKGVIKVNSSPLDMLEPAVLRTKVYEPLLLLGVERFAKLDIRIKVRGGGYTARIYAIRQCIARGIVAYHQKYVDEQSKREIKELLLQYDRTLLVADSRRCETKKFGGTSARAKRQKSYR